jgi:hypothetical protein
MDGRRPTEDTIRHGQEYITERERERRRDKTRQERNVSDSVTKRRKNEKRREIDNCALVTVGRECGNE